MTSHPYVIRVPCQYNDLYYSSQIPRYFITSVFVRKKNFQNLFLKILSIKGKAKPIWIWLLRKCNKKIRGVDKNKFLRRKLCCKTRTNIMQIKVVEIKYILLWYIIWKKESKKRIEKVKERERERENERKNFLLFLGMLLHGG